MWLNYKDENGDCKINLCKVDFIRFKKDEIEFYTDLIEKTFATVKRKYNDNFDKIVEELINFGW